MHNYEKAVYLAELSDGAIDTILEHQAKKTDYDTEGAWSRDYWAALVPHAVGVGSYVNFMTECDEARVRDAYGTRYERLEQIKAVYDPDNVFHLKPNIPPAS